MEERVEKPSGIYEISSLVCHRHVADAVCCLGSLRRFPVEKLMLNLHDDGTLTGEDLAALASGLPGCRIIARREGDEIAGEALRGHPYCAALRKRNAMAIKIFDTVLASGGRHYIFADTDVLFLRPWAGLFTLPTNGANAVFMLNPGDAYCISPLGYLATPRLGLPRRLNSGLCVLRRSSYDLDFFEWLIRSPAFRTRQAEWLIDQTVWAAAAYRMGLAFWSESNVAIAAPGVQPAELVAGHFAGGRRKFIQEAAKLAATAPRPAELAVPLVESERLSRSCCSRQWVMLKWNRGRDRMSRLLNRGGGAGIIRG